MQPYKKLIELIEEGAVDAKEVLLNVLNNYMSRDEANEFARSEYEFTAEDYDEDLP